MKNKIIIPTDLTMAADQAIRQAAVIAGKTRTGLILLHVLNDKSPSLSVVEATLKTTAENIQTQNGLPCEIMIKEGNIFEVIPFTVCEHDYDMMVIGTHGIRGIKQKLLGADILKLVARIPIPVLVVQEESPIIETFTKIILPVSSHQTFMQAVEAIICLAGSDDPEVNIYSVHKPGFEWPEMIIKNIEDATAQFQKNGIRFTRIKEEQQVYSLGYAKQTLKYADSINADTICMMSVPSKEYYYFAQSDKETLLLNESRIPILCAGGGNLCK